MEIPVKFTSEGGRVIVRASLSEENVRVAVIDTGQGIDPDFLPQIFEPFRQADGSSTRRHGGIGLGLAIVKRLIEAHGGRIQATSAGKAMGATFLIDLPVCRDDRAEVVVTDHTFADHRRQLNHVRVLVVDDDKDARDLLQSVLGDQGAEVLTASSALYGLTALERFRPHVVVSDLAMPGVDGYEFMRTIRSLPAERGWRVPGHCFIGIRSR